MPDRNIPTKRGVKTYLSIRKHQKNNSENFAKWKSQNLEIEAFDNADCGTVINGVHLSWECDSHLWGFIKNNGIV